MNALETKLIGSAAFAVLAALGGLVWRRVWLWRRYHGLAGRYRVTKKVTNASEAELVIKTRGNVLKVSYTNLPEGDWVRGDISMRPEILLRPLS
jgi:hypothetical protein